MHLLSRRGCGSACQKQLRHGRAFDPATHMWTAPSLQVWNQALIGSLAFICPACRSVLIVAMLVPAKPAPNSIAAFNATGWHGVSGFSDGSITPTFSFHASSGTNVTRTRAGNANSCDGERGETFRSRCGLHRPVAFTRHHQSPGNSCGLVGEGDSGQLARLSLQQRFKPWQLVDT